MKITLTDGTQVEDTFDFDVAYGPLPRLNQGQHPMCWMFQWAVQLDAYARMYDGRHLNVDAMELGDAEDGPTAKVWTLPDGSTVRTDYSGDNYWSAHPDLSKREAIIRGVWLNGVAELGVTCQRSFDRLWRHPLGQHAHALPVLEPTPGDLAAARRNSWTHATLAVGYTHRGVICQNSWGRRFGLDGRVVLSWAMVDACVDAFLVDTYQDHPLDSRLTASGG